MNKPWRPSSITLGKPGFVSTTIGRKERHTNVDLPGGYSWRSKPKKHKDKDKEDQDPPASASGSQAAASSESTASKNNDLAATKMKTFAVGFMIGALCFATDIGSMLLHLAF